MPLTRLSTGLLDGTQAQQGHLPHPPHPSAPLLLHPLLLEHLATPLHQKPISSSWGQQ